MAGIIAYSPVIGPIPIDVFIREQHEHSLGITSNPIETGAEVNDHAYVKPKRLTLEIADKNGALTFNALVQLKDSRVPFSIVTGLFVYNNMLIENLPVTRDEKYSQILYGTVELKEILFVSNSYVAASETDPALTGEPGGSKSISASTPTASATDAATADKVAGTVQRGDNPVTTVPDSEASVLYQMFGGS